MKKLLNILFIWGFAIVAMSCESQQDLKPAIEIPQESKTFFADGMRFDSGEASETQSQAVKFTAGDKWSATVSDATKASSWLKVEPTGGDAGDVTLTVIAQPNDDQAERSAIVTITCGAESESFTVTQAGKPVPAFADKWLTFTSEGTTSVSLLNFNNNAPLLYYSFDRTSWEQWDYSELSFSSSVPLYLCGDNPEGFSKSQNQVSIFLASGSSFSVSGDLMSLLDKNQDVFTIPSDYCFAGLFAACEGLTLAPELPATVLTDGCYSSMFEGCSSLVKAPELPATALASGCYSTMFRDCTSLSSAPGLPATTLADQCYSYMFYGCTGLSAAPALPATTLAYGCYWCMFSDCTSLAIAPELPATTLAEGCYENMFSGCRALASAPELPATTLAEYCYSAMFSSCRALVSAPALPATTLAEACYQSMFLGCKSLTTAPALPATTLAKVCYNGMFALCSSLVSAPDLPAATLAEGCYAGMFNSCSGLIKAPELPATALAPACYGEMFRECTSLTIAPELPATTLPEQCYYSMFSNCTSLTIAPELPATTLPEQCYYSMFSNCTNLNYVKCLATDVSASLCIYRWLDGVAPAGTFIKDALMNNWPQDAIPDGWIVQNSDLSPIVDPAFGDINGHQWVDLGLSSGLKWATCNIGAGSPEEYGDYFAWGETEPYYSSQDPLTWKDGKSAGYDWVSYKFELGTDEQGPFSKYVTDNYDKIIGNVDNNTVLDPEDDAAAVNWGGTWRMPTDAEWTELGNECTWTWTTQNGVAGRLVTGPNGNSIFLPAAGYRYNTLLGGAGSIGYYWSSSLNTGSPSDAYNVRFFSDDVYRDSRYRYLGRSVRPVTE